MVKKPNFELKAKVIGNGCAKIQRKLSLSNWKNRQLESEIYNLELEQELYGLDNTEKLEELEQKKDKVKRFQNLYDEKINSYTEEEIREAERVNDAGHKRTKRLKDRISMYLENENAIFLTLTFRPDVLENTTPQTRRDYVRKFLKSQCKYYVANIDFGKLNEREHYHAVVVPIFEKINGETYRKKCGSIDFERVWHKVDESDYENTSKRLAKYVNKLTNHAIKETTHQNRVIYSKN